MNEVICQVNQCFLNQLTRIIPMCLWLISMLDNYIHAGTSLPDMFSLMINVLVLDSQTFCLRQSVFTPAGTSVDTQTVATIWWLIL